MNVLMVWMSLTLVLVAEIAMSCQCAIPPSIFGSSFSFSKEDVFIVEYTVDGQQHDARKRITVHNVQADGSERELITNTSVALNANYFNREGDHYVIGRPEENDAIKLLRKAEAIAKLENPQAQDISVRFYRASSKRSKLNSMRKEKKGYPVYLALSLLNTRNFPN